MTDKNVAAVVTTFGEPPELREYPFRKMAPGSVMIQVDAATLCGTDSHRWKGHLPQGGPDQPFLKPLDMPYTPGHESCGTIVEIEGEARDIAGDKLCVGDRIISSYGSCGHCYYCRVTRQTSFCNDTMTFGHSSPEKMIGGCAKYQYFPAEGAFVRAPSNVSAAVVASGTCALRTVMHGVEQLGRIEGHESVLVLGAGPLGLYSLAAVREQGASSTMIIGAPQPRLAVANNWGADHTLNIDDEPDVERRVAWVRDLTAGRGADIVINCATGHALVEGIRMARPGGRLVQIAVGGGGDIMLPPGMLVRGVKLLFPITAEDRHFYQAMQFLEAKRDRYCFDDMISNRYELEETGTALENMFSLTETKPVIYPNGSATGLAEA